MNSKIINRRYAKQLIDFANITIGNKGMPTDCDGLIEYHGKAYVLFELKYRGADVPLGQWLALVRMCDDFNRLHKPALLSLPSMTLTTPTLILTPPPATSASSITRANGTVAPARSKL